MKHFQPKQPVNIIMKVVASIINDDEIVRSHFNDSKIIKELRAEYSNSEDSREGTILHSFLEQTPLA